MRIYFIYYVIYFEMNSIPAIKKLTMEKPRPLC